jgi:RNA polymerase sigma-70 factor (ECF subfamily)
MASESAEIAVIMDNPGVCQSSAEGTSAPIADLVERARAGDPAAFEQMIICYQRRVVSTAWRILGSEEDARDAAQEVFLRAYKYLGKFKQGHDFTGWLYGIVINVCRDMARKRRRREGRFTSLEVERELGNLEALRSQVDVEAAAISSQQQALVRRALEMLSRREREAIVLRDLEGLSTQEVARILGSSQTTVRSQISSARAKIKKYHERLLERGRRGAKL